MSIFKGTTEPKKMYLGEIDYDYSAMQGPCPSGYHIPTKDELSELVGILQTTFGLAKNIETVKTYLKMPPAGNRDSTNGSVANQGTYATWWSSIKDNSGGRGLGAGSTYSSITTNGAGQGKPIRPFKDNPVIPDNSWTTLYNGSSVALGAGVFHNASLGLISASGNGIKWITISDKNLGATTIYNSGDALSEANCGKYYQRGNNYGFPRTGNVSTTPTQVAAIGYGPGNYYSNSTFRTGNNRDMSDNRNLRGGQTGPIDKSEIKSVYLGTTKVRPRELNIEWLLVGGGGAGGFGGSYVGGGGGGGGGVIYCDSYVISPGDYCVIVGSGGTTTTGYCKMNKGCNSFFGNIVAYGGGAGTSAISAYYGCTTSGWGGSGGGAAGKCTTGSNTGGGCVSGQGKAGGNSQRYAGGGGGGYCSAGYTGTANVCGGKGGCGYLSNISGVNVWYSSGGSAGGCTCNIAGVCGGGCGGRTISGACGKGGNATTYGSGGGGGGAYRSCACGGCGKQGIFIARYPTACGYNITGGCKYTCGNYTIHCFTSSGTLTVG